MKGKQKNFTLNRPGIALRSLHRQFEEIRRKCARAIALPSCPTASDPSITGRFGPEWNGKQKFLFHSPLGTLIGLTQFIM